MKQDKHCLKFSNTLLKSIRWSFEFCRSLFVNVRCSFVHSRCLLKNVRRSFVHGRSLFVDVRRPFVHGKSLFKSISRSFVPRSSLLVELSWLFKRVSRFFDLFFIHLPLLIQLILTKNEFCKFQVCLTFSVLNHIRFFSTWNSCRAGKNIWTIVDDTNL